MNGVFNQSMRRNSLPGSPKEFGPEFLRWFQTATEQAWQNVDELSLADFSQAGRIGSAWRPGTRWTGGLSESAIRRLEHDYQLEFPPQYRLFLRMLHSTTPWQRQADYAVYGDRLALREVPGFYDWLHDGPQIRAAMRDVAGVLDAMVKSF